MVQFFKLDQEPEQFAEDESLKISSDGTISFYEFDRNFENIFFLENRQVLQRINMSDVKTVQLSIKLETAVHSSDAKQLAISNDDNAVADHIFI